MTKRYDLQVHSLYSDGTDKPEAIIDMAKALGLSGISITDHDTLGAYKNHLELYAASRGVELLVGIEMSTTFDGHQIDILGFGVQDREPLRSLIVAHQRSREEKNREILKKLTAHKMPISEEELFNVPHLGSLGRPHIAQVMVQKGYVPSIDQAFRLWIGDGRPCYEEGEPFDLLESIHAIQNSGGVAILAHPHLIREEKVLNRLLEFPFDGMEVFYGNKRRHECARFVTLARKKGWLMSGGSDYHGAHKTYIHLGNSWVSEIEYQALLRAIQRRAESLS